MGDAFQMMSTEKEIWIYFAPPKGINLNPIPPAMTYPHSSKS
jgi:hypothetical protein